MKKKLKMIAEDKEMQRLSETVLPKKKKKLFDRMMENKKKLKEKK